MIDRTEQADRHHGVIFTGAAGLIGRLPTHHAEGARSVYNGHKTEERRQVSWATGTRLYDLVVSVLDKGLAQAYHSLGVDSERVVLEDVMPDVNAAVRDDIRKIVEILHDNDADVHLMDRRRFDVNASTSDNEADGADVSSPTTASSETVSKTDASTSDARRLTTSTPPPCGRTGCFLTRDHTHVSDGPRWTREEHDPLTKLGEAWGIPADLSVEDLAFQLDVYRPDYPSTGREPFTSQDVAALTTALVTVYNVAQRNETALHELSAAQWKDLLVTVLGSAAIRCRESEVDRAVVAAQHWVSAAHARSRHHGALNIILAMAGRQSIYDMDTVAHLMDMTTEFTLYAVNEKDGYDMDELPPNTEIFVTKRGPNSWAVRNGYGWTYDATGRRAVETQTTNRTDAYLRQHRFTRDEAIRVARDVVLPKLRMEALRRYPATPRQQ